MHDFSGMADAGGMGYPPSPLIGPWPRVFGCGAGVVNLQDLVYEALSEEWRKRDGEDDDPWENHGPDGYQPPSYEPVNPERRTAQTPSDGLI